MAGYTYRWTCVECGERQDTIDKPRLKLCDRCRPLNLTTDGTTKPLTGGLLSQRCPHCGEEI